MKRLAIETRETLQKFKDYALIQKISQLLQAKSRLCWISGGAVRDMLLGRAPYDIDLTTDATEEEILELFPQAMLVGRQFGVYKIPFRKNENESVVIDLTVFRAEDGYEDGRRPNIVVRATPDLDAQRRDFTVNALFFDLLTDEIVDYVGGLHDLQHKILRCVGEPKKRFDEDHLRLLRLVRFQSQLSFVIDSETLNSALMSVDLIKTVSGERFFDELYKATLSLDVPFFYKQELTQKLLIAYGIIAEAPTHMQIECLAKIKSNIIWSEQIKLLLVALGVLINFNVKNALSLKDKLKLARADYDFLSKICKLYQLVAGKYESKFRLMALLDHMISDDKNLSFSDYQNVITYYIECGWFSLDMWNEFVVVRERYNEPLISRQELFELIRSDSQLNTKYKVQISDKMAEIMQDVREKQFCGKLISRSEAVSYIKSL